MAIELFLRLDGVTGGARNFAHRGWCDVLSWHWDLQRIGDIASLNELEVVKPVGLDSPALVQRLVEKTVIPKAQFSAVPTVGKREAAQKYLEMSLEDVTIQSIQGGGSTEDSLFTETVRLSFSRIHYELHQHTMATPGGSEASTESLAFDWNNTASAPAVA
ncbi:MAG: type VI secretion system tube protein Hcp [Gammaproteobacteria bacterium]|nr:type VI secretion system tube protein Hcp [Gammaproteobacteria bacterium]